MRLALIFGILIAVIAVIFAVQNPGFTDITVGTVTYRTLTALALIIAFGAGALAGILFTLPSAIKNRRRVRILEKRLVTERSGDTVVERRVVDTPTGTTEVRRRDTAL
jgi:uncharacterized integral membrane protein